MKTLDQLTSRELEIELLRRKIGNAAEQIDALEQSLAVLRGKQSGRIRELAVQETQLKFQETETQRTVRETVARMRE